MIKTTIGNFDGDSWENFCHTCLTLKFEAEGYQKLPAWQGDLGIESYTRSGKVFQCYCPDDEYDPKTLYEKQRDKVTRDLEKLEKNQKELKLYLGEQKITEWIFLTPMFKNKEIVKHCKVKASEYQKKKIDILSPDFDVLVFDTDYFIEQIRKVKGSQSDKLEIIVDRDENLEIDWQNANSDLVEHALSKNYKRVSDDPNKEKTRKLTNNTIGNYMEGQQILKKWKELVPCDYEKFLRIVGVYEETVEDMCITNSDNNNNQLFDRIKKELKDKLGVNFKNYEDLTLEKLTKGVLADWILRCPINFE